MPGLTVAERTHWKDRIAARIDRAVEQLKARHPEPFERARREAHAQALGSLGIEGPHAELEAVRAEEAALARRKLAAQRAMLAALRGTNVEEVADGFAVRYGTGPALPAEAVEAITRREAAHRERLLADDPVGREVARLRAEREALLDTVWLATSPTQVRELWAKVAELLGEEPTRLEREALSIAPNAEG